MRNVKETLRDAMLNGTPGQRKALLKELVVEVRVEGRDGIVPTFRLPTAPVRVTEAVVGRGGLEPPTPASSSQERAQFVDGVFVTNQLGPMRAGVPVEAQVIGGMRPA